MSIFIKKNEAKWASNILSIAKKERSKFPFHVYCRAMIVWNEWKSQMSSLFGKNLSMIFKQKTFEKKERADTSL